MAECVVGDCRNPKYYYIGKLAAARSRVWMMQRHKPALRGGQELDAWANVCAFLHDICYSMSDQYGNLLGRLVSSGVDWAFNKRKRGANTHAQAYPTATDLSLCLIMSRFNDEGLFSFWLDRDRQRNRVFDIWLKRQPADARRGGTYDTLSSNDRIRFDTHWHAVKELAIVLRTHVLFYAEVQYVRAGHLGLVADPVHSNTGPGHVELRSVEEIGLAVANVIKSTTLNLDTLHGDNPAKLWIFPSIANEVTVVQAAENQSQVPQQLYTIDASPYAAKYTKLQGKDTVSLHLHKGKLHSLQLVTGATFVSDPLRRLLKASMSLYDNWANTKQDGPCNFHVSHTSEYVNPNAPTEAWGLAGALNAYAGSGVAFIIYEVNGTRPFERSMKIKEGQKDFVAELELVLGDDACTTEQKTSAIRKLLVDGPLSLLGEIRHGVDQMDHPNQLRAELVLRIAASGGEAAINDSIDAACIEACKRLNGLDWSEMCTISAGSAYPFLLEQYSSATLHLCCYLLEEYVKASPLVDAAFLEHIYAAFGSVGHAIDSTPMRPLTDAFERVGTAYKKVSRTHGYFRPELVTFGGLPCFLLCITDVANDSVFRSRLPLSLHNKLKHAKDRTCARNTCDNAARVASIEAAVEQIMGRVEPLYFPTVLTHLLGCATLQELLHSRLVAGMEVNMYRKIVGTSRVLVGTGVTRLYVKERPGTKSAHISGDPTYEYTDLDDLDAAAWCQTSFAQFFGHKFSDWLALIGNTRSRFCDDDTLLLTPKTQTLSEYVVGFVDDLLRRINNAKLKRGAGETITDKGAPLLIFTAVYKVLVKLYTDLLHADPDRAAKRIITAILCVVMCQAREDGELHILPCVSAFSRNNSHARKMTLAHLVGKKVDDLPFLNESHNRLKQFSQKIVQRRSLQLFSSCQDVMLLRPMLVSMRRQGLLWAKMFGDRDIEIFLLDGRRKNNSRVKTTTICVPAGGNTAMPRREAAADLEDSAEQRTEEPVSKTV